MTKLRLVTLATCIVAVAACSTSPESDPAYVSPNHYANYNCNQIAAEMQRVSAKLEQRADANTTGQVLGAAVAVFAISRGYGIQDDDDTSYRRLYNQYEVLEQTSIQKECFSQ